MTGAPKSFLLVGNYGKRLSVFIPDDGAEPIMECPLADIDITHHVLDGMNGLLVWTDNPELLKAFYVFACSMIDEVIEEGASAAMAFQHTAAALKDLLAERAILSDERQAGLIGELCFLNLLCGTMGSERAIASWHSNANAEHDFDIGELDIEVKSTMSEKRWHIIGSLTQLNPSNNRLLYLASFQFTRAASGVSFSLPSLHDNIRDLAMAHSDGLADVFERRIEAAGWNPAHKAYYRLQLRERSAPRLIPVLGDFPAIVPSTLASLAKNTSSRIIEVSYRVDVEGLGYNLDKTAIETLVGDDNE